MEEESLTFQDYGIGVADVMAWLEQPVTRYVMSQIETDQRAAESDAIALLAKGDVSLHQKASICASYAEALSKVYWFVNAGLIDAIKVEDAKRKEAEHAA